MRAAFRAAVLKEPLKKELGPISNVVFEMLQGAPMGWVLSIGSALILGVYVAARVSVPEQIQVASEPVGAQVFVDGEAKGVTPLAVRDLKKGRHFIEVRQQGFHSKVISAEIAAFASDEYAVRLNPIPPPPDPALVAEQPRGVVAELFGPTPGKEPEPRLAMARKPRPTR